MKDYSKEYREDIRKSKEMDKGEVKNELDALFANIYEYRTSRYYRELLNFCKKFKQLAPFNAMMVQIQRPACQFILTAEQWERKYRRKIAPNARPVVILNFTPVSYLYDISDTEKKDDYSLSDYDILEEIKHQYDTKQEIHSLDLNLLIENLAVLGIAYTDSFRAGASYGAQIRLLENPKVIDIPINKNHRVKYKAHYLLSVNETLSNGAKYASILHELGHFLCKHLPPPSGKDWWKVRPLTKNEKEFEAESVAWLICERLNIGNPSEKYLAGYLDSNSTIPQNISIDHIFKAQNEIYKLLFELQYAKDHFLYKTDNDFKELINNSPYIVQSRNNHIHKQLKIDF